jgi:hypothetical protein
MTLKPGKSRFSNEHMKRHSFIKQLCIVNKVPHVHL